jgi:hypothetical protein
MFLFVDVLKIDVVQDSIVEELIKMVIALILFKPNKLSVLINNSLVPFFCQVAHLSFGNKNHKLNQLD